MGKVEVAGNVGATAGGVIVVSGNLADANNVTNIYNCYNVGEVIGNEAQQGSWGAVVGRHFRGTLDNIYYANWNTTNWVAGTNTNSSKCYSFNKDEILGLPAKLGSTYFTNDTKGINNGYPILKWELEIED